MGLPGKPVAEVTKLDWVILSLEKENASTNILFTKTCGYWREKNDETNEFVYGEFRKQASRESVANYETDLIWKENYPPLRSNEVNSFDRLHNLTKSLILSNKFEEYTEIIQEQINECFIEEVNETKICEKGNNSICHIDL